MASRRRLAPLLAGPLAALLLVSGCGGSPSPGPKKEKESGGSASASSSATAAHDTPASPEPTYGMPRAGQCFQLSAKQSRAAVSTGRKVACRQPHTTVVAYAGVVPKAITARTPLAQRRAVAARVCRPAFARTAGGSPADRATSLLTWAFYTPSADQLERGARWVRCDVIARSGTVLVPLSTKPPLLGAGVPENLRVCQGAGGMDISCTRKHVFRVEAVYRETRAAYPGPKGYTETARDRCKELMEGYGGYWQPPSRAGWAAGDRFIRCLKQDQPAG